MKKLGWGLLLMFCGFLFLNTLWGFYIPPWTSAEILGADIAKGIFMWFFGYGVLYSWRKIRTPQAKAPTSK
jgi:hypothetical protein